MRIPTYLQEKLASSIVGTAGVDSSGNALAESSLKAGRALSGAAAEVSRRGLEGDQLLQRIAIQSFGQVSQELSIRRRQQAELQAYSDKLSNDAALARHKMEFSGALEEIVAQRKLDGREDPMNVGQGLRKDSDRLVSDYIKNNGLTGNFAGEFKREAFQMLGSQQKEISNWAYSQRKENDKVAASAAADGYLARVSNLGGDKGRFLRERAAFDGMQESFAELKGPAGIIEHDEKRKKSAFLFIKGAINGNADLVPNPDLGEVLLGDKDINSDLTADQAFELRNAIDARRKDFIQEKEFKDHINSTALRGEIIASFTVANASGSAERPDINALIKSRDKVKTIIDAELAKKPEDRNLAVLKEGNATLDKLQSEVRGYNADQLKIQREAERDAKDAVREANRAAADARRDIRDAEHKAHVAKIEARGAFYDGAGGDAWRDYTAVKRNVMRGLNNKSAFAQAQDLNKMMDFLREAADHAPKEDPGIAQKIELELKVISDKRERLQRHYDDSKKIEATSTALQAKERGNPGGLFGWGATAPVPLSASERFHLAVSNGAPPSLHTALQATEGRQKFTVDTDWTGEVAHQMGEWQSENPGKQPSRSDLVKIVQQAQTVMKGRDYPWMKKTK